MSRVNEKYGMIRWLLGLMLLCCVAGCGTASSIKIVKIADSKDGDYLVKIDRAGFKFSFLDKQGGQVAPAYAATGLQIDGQPVKEVKVVPFRPETFQVSTTSGQKAKVKVAFKNGVVVFTVIPSGDDAHHVSLNLGGMPVAHGLGDTAAWEDSFNLVQEETKTHLLFHDGGSKRWMSSFVIFPNNGIAGVHFEEGDKEVTIGPDQYSMTIKKAGPVSFYYLLGDMKTIYTNYLDLRQQLGYPNIKPKFRLFELGWESWDALRWKANAETVQESIDKFLKNGYPIRWAVTGSGFWPKGGTTTSFGEFGERFPNPAEFKNWMHAHNVKWLIGQRVGLVPSGGPYYPGHDKRDSNLDANAYSGNPLSDIALKKDYFLRTEDGEIWKQPSSQFPQVPCYLLDGRKPKAAKWFCEQYEKWGVDGIKEDTMMKLGSNYDFFNGTMEEIANNGYLVMARCGTFSMPGTLARINDTGGASSMTKRAPINYMQYAACGAPNVYSDTVGFSRMNEVESSMRHGWLCSVTAGLSVGPYPEKWSEQEQAMFKKMINFHYQLTPYMYDSAMKSYQSGYPYTLTPISIAYPNDEKAAQAEHYEWLIGESILAAPLLIDYESGKMNLYLPEGTWFDYDTGKKYTGPTVLENFEMPLGKTPCFVGGKGIIVLRDSDEAPLKAKIYPIVKDDSSFTFYYPDGSAKSVLSLNTWNGQPQVTDTATGQKISCSVEAETGAVMFEMTPDHNYRIQ